VAHRLAVLGSSGGHPKDGNLGYPPKEAGYLVRRHSLDEDERPLPARNLSVASTTAFRRIPPIPETNLEGAVRVEAV
jgi:hypothetical protein